MNTLRSKAAIDCALYEIMSRSLGAPLYKLFGGKRRLELPVMRVLSLKEPHEMALKGRELVEAGYRHIKIKVYGRLALDTARVKAIRQEVGPDIRLIIDANQAYKPKAAIQLAENVVQYSVEIFEQPCKSDDYAGLKLVTPSLKGLRVLAGEASLAAPGSAGVDLTGIPLLAGSSLPAKLQPRIGRPLYFTDIARISAEIRSACVAAGRQFVQVIVPPQDITSGVLTFVVIEAKLGQLKVVGAKSFSEASYREEVLELLRWVGLGHRLWALPPILSGGEKQRAAIARAVISKPELLLADEPTGNVDPQMARRLLRLFIELNRLGTSVVIATHDHQLMRQTKAPRLELHEGHVRIV